MVDASAIEWTDNTHNHWEGCTKVSPACEFCYAERRNIRFTGGANWGPGAPRRLTSDANRRKPLAWNRAAERTGERPWVFCSSLADVFDNEVPETWRAELWALIEATPLLRWQLLTKRVGNARKMLPPPDVVRAKWQHVGVMATVENQEVAERDIPKLLDLKPSHGVKWCGLSCEPLLAAIDLARMPWADGGSQHRWDALTGQALMYAIGLDGQPDCTVRLDNPIRPALDWVICGGEADPARQGRARPIHPDWARGLRDQCAKRSVPFFFKQWGDWAPGRTPEHTDYDWSSPVGTIDLEHAEVSIGACGRTNATAYSDQPDIIMRNVGKKAAGRQLDGRTHDDMPTRGNL